MAVHFVECLKSHPDDISNVLIDESKREMRFKSLETSEEGKKETFVGSRKWDTSGFANCLHQTVAAFVYKPDENPSTALIKNPHKNNIIDLRCQGGKLLVEELCFQETG